MSFEYKNHQLFCDLVKVEDLVQEFDTPLYIYSGKKIKEQVSSLKRAFQASGLKAKIHYSVKSNSNLSILKLLKNEGASFDIVSGGELLRLRKLGVEGSEIVFSGVGKTKDEIDLGIKEQICFFNVESAAELDLILERAKFIKSPANVALRINPNVDASTHEYITTGTSASKFGINMDVAMNLYLSHKKNPYLNWCGLDMHIGSQLVDEKPIMKALKIYSSFAESLLSEGLPIKYLDVGGGLGIQYSVEKIISAKKFVGLISKGLENPKLKNCTIIVEPGRFLVGEAGILVTKLLFEKSQSGKTFYIVDAGMNDLIRPALYEAYHDVKSLRDDEGENLCVDLVGPVCESADFFAKDRLLPKLKMGDHLAIFNTGAYGASMSSNYNSRLRAAEVLVDGSVKRLIRPRETYQELFEKEFKLL